MSLANYQPTVWNDI